MICGSTTQEAVMFENALFLVFYVLPFLAFAICAAVVSE